MISKYENVETSRAIGRGLRGENPFKHVMKRNKQTARVDDWLPLHSQYNRRLGRIVTKPGRLRASKYVSTLVLGHG